MMMMMSSREQLPAPAEWVPATAANARLQLTTHAHLLSATRLSAARLSHAPNK
jgi:hypothetical protein